MHPHKTKGQRQRKARRLARLAWRNYAILEGYKIIIDNNIVTLIRSRDGVVHRTTGINVTMSPARVIQNPEILAWFLDVDQMAQFQAERERARQANKKRLELKYDEASTILAGYHHRRASRAK